MNIFHLTDLSHHFFRKCCSVYPFYENMKYFKGDKMYFYHHDIIKRCHHKWAEFVVCLFVFVCMYSMFDSMSWRKGDFINIG